MSFNWVTENFRLLKINIRKSKTVFFLLFISLAITATAQPEKTKKKVTLQNLWTQNYLTIDNNKAALGQSTEWEIVPSKAQPGYFFIKLFQTSAYLNMETGYLGLGIIDPKSKASVWKIEQVPGENNFRVISGLNEHQLNNQTGSISVSAAEPGWWSARWIMTDLGVAAGSVSASNSGTESLQQVAANGHLSASYSATASPPPVTTNGHLSASYSAPTTSPPVITSGTLSASYSGTGSSQQLTFNGKPINPAAFAGFFPNMESGAFTKSTDLNSIGNQNEAPPVMDAEGYYSVSANGTFLKYKWLGKTTSGLHAYRVWYNMGGSFTQSSVFLVELGSLLYRKGMLSTQDIGNKQIVLRGNDLYFGNEVIPINSLLNN